MFDAPGMGFPHYQLVVLGVVFLQHRTCSHDIAEAHAQRPHDSSLASQEYGWLIQHDTPGHIAYEGGCCLIPVRGEIEVDIRASHLTVIIPTGSPCHQAVTEVDETAERHEWEEDGLFEADAMGPASLFFQDGSFTDMGSEPHVRFIKKYGSAEIAAFELYILPYLTVFNGNWPLITYPRSR